MLLRIKTPTETFPVECDTSGTVMEFKEAIAAKCAVAADQQRLIYKGRLLKDTDKMDDYKPENDSVVHMVVGKKQDPPASNSAAAPAGAEARAAGPTSTPAAAGAQPQVPPQMPDLSALFGGLGAMPPGAAAGGAGLDLASLLGNPAVQQMMQNMTQSMAQTGTTGIPGATGPANSPFGPMGLPMDLNTIMALMGNPMVQTMMQQMLANPQLMQTMLQSNPMLSQMMAAANPQAQADAANPLFMQNMMQLLGGAGMAPFAAGVPPVGAAPASGPDAYRRQLDQMREMGFPNEQANLVALQQCGGNVEMAIDRLLR
eukprot:NODE_634_length_1285_cov_149.711165_g500_i0.p1 GENE.NODE_634_length_1285_cov_149.711165_g500_i0~~NODE_634_length_1285_cov_149.711165_g500_i0.p1  ORF type:complete len:315 (+),score=59.79 NODE_634_length_1285_cov_149.711165_g500_i0:64-1008(+)